ncbi:MAG: hypothetical protein Q8Q09_28975 [Deltaproteobacteria bacterium]|nr:hypothetical protein [Deltaproteobacteria bacterium]
MALGACGPTEPELDVARRDATTDTSVRDVAASDTQPLPDASVEASTVADAADDVARPTDSGAMEADAQDGSADAAPDAVSVDAARVDAMVGMDSMVDASSEGGGVTMDAAPEASPDATPDASREAGAEAGPEAGIAPGTSPAGGPCAANVDCRAGLTCDTTVRDGFCSAGCRNSTSQFTEQTQCGGASSTCLASGDPPTESTFCTAACRPGPGSGCRTGQICTGLWASHAMGRPDAPGCLPFCFSNADCPAGEVCNTRTGSCGATGSNPAALTDGSICTIPAAGAPSPCRGICFRVTTGGTQGLCGSLVDLALTSSCPDGPAIRPLAPATDNLGYCIFRECSATNCCPAGLVCEGAGPTGSCTIDDPLDPNIACR